MSGKKTVLHIIQNFGRGGAETAVVGVLKKLNDYNNIVVTLDSLNEFGDDLRYDKYYSLELSSYYLFPLAIKKLRKIILENKVDIVHSQLFWSTVLARYATPKNIPLITSIQASVSGSVEYKKKWIGWLDQISYNRRPSIILGVSRHTLEDYFSYLKLEKYKTGILYNFVDTGVFKTLKPEPPVPGKFRLVSVGNLKPQKNQIFLLEAFKRLKGTGISLDIYGDGMLESAFSQIIKTEDLPVRLMGKVKDLHKTIHKYDLFVMSSLYEGFSLAVLEGMVMEKPMLLSDIPTFTEQCGDTAIYFSLQNVDDLVNKIKLLQGDPLKLTALSLAAKERVLSHFTLEHHLKSLRQIYQDALNNV